MDKHTVAFLLLDVAVIIAAARIGGMIARAVRQPAVVGEIAAGLALGPSLLGLLPGSPDEWLFPGDVRPLLGGLAQIGLVLFMFIVGLELDMRLTRGRERAAASISASSIVVPFGLGAALGFLLYPAHDSVDGVHIERLGMVLFTGVAMSITAFPVLARILTDRGMMRTVPGVFSLAAAAVDDILAWTLLAFIIAVISGGSPVEVAEIVGLTLVYAAVMFGLVRPLLAKLVEWRDTAGRLTPDILAVILIGVFLSSTATDVIGIHQIFGAFMFGAVMPKVGAERLHREILERLEQVSVLLLLPMFFVVTGLSVDLAAIGVSGLWQLGLVLLVAVAGKFCGAYAGARLSAIPTRQSAAIAVLMNTRGLTELVILSAGRDLGVLSDDLFAMLVVMALVTTVLTEPLLRLVYPDSVVDSDIAAAERRALAAATAPRVMVVLRDPAGTVEELRDRHRRMLDCATGYDVVLAGVLTSPDRRSARLEVGVPVVPDFAAIAEAIEKLNLLGSSLTGAGAVSVLCRFSADPAADLDAMAENAGADVIVVDSADRGIAERLRAAPVAVVDEAAAPGAAPGRGVVTCVSSDGRAGRTAVVLAAGLALFGSRTLTVVSGASRRRLLNDLRPVSQRGVAITVVDPRRHRAEDGSFVVAGAAGEETGAAVTVLDNARTSEESLGERITTLYALADAADAADATSSSTTSSPERH
ncbi:glutathione-regulated potassium-efflux system protein KefB [Gordonia paraffinivorans]|uniref:Glutathione-regulated potassium-efflux system protein KefB n=1 Tax=Gordonia paraffinivorans TaxID=175628 RepID=A0ABD7V753_9ACTN|nr:cation:proton antiporter [Gordonia paraffinivorans]VFA90129.1 glutathione-regulated potassium-efflux system protein KefB [Gordonia paraffinivorans]